MSGNKQRRHSSSLQASLICIFEGSPIQRNCQNQAKGDYKRINIWAIFGQILTSIAGTEMPLGLTTESWLIRSRQHGAVL